MAGIRRLLPTALALAACAAASPPAAGAPLHDLCLGDFRPLASPHPLFGEPSAFLSASARLCGAPEPELFLAQRAIDRDIVRSPRAPEDPSQYQYVDVEGWRSPALAGGMSAVLPGTGQLYSGQQRGYIYLGIQTLALYTFFHFDDRADDRQGEAFAYAGDPNATTSRWSFERFEQVAGAEETDQLREIYSRDPNEFYSRVSSDSRYFSGWVGDTETEKVNAVAGYKVIDEERVDAQRASNLGLFAAIANSVVSAVDAFRAARLNNIQIEEDWNLRLKAKTGRDAGLTAFVTHRFH